MQQLENVNPELIRQNFLAGYIKDEITKRGLTLSEVAERSATTQPNLSNALNGTKLFSRNYFIKVMKGLGLTTPEIREIEKKVAGDYYYMLGGTELTEKELTLEEAFDFIKKHYNLNEEQLKSIKTVIKMQRN